MVVYEDWLTNTAQHYVQTYHTDRKARMDHHEDLVCGVQLWKKAAFRYYVGYCQDIVKYGEFGQKSFSKTLSL